MKQGRDFTCAEQAGLFSLAWRKHHKHLVQKNPQRQKFSAHSQWPSPSAVKAYLQEGRAEVFTAGVRRVSWLTHSLRCWKQALKNAHLEFKNAFSSSIYHHHHHEYQKCGLFFFSFFFKMCSSDFLYVQMYNIHKTWV